MAPGLHQKRTRGCRDTTNVKERSALLMNVSDMVRAPSCSHRRKDPLQQEYGYVVPRVLTEDVGKHLDQVPDPILRTLSHRQRMLRAWKMPFFGRSHGANRHAALRADRGRVAC